MSLATVPSRRRTLDIPTIAPLTSETTIAILLRDPTIKHLPRRTTIRSETRTRSRNQGQQEINKMIRALTIEERDEMFVIAEAGEEEKGPNEKDFS